jgi:hypothetical protein
MLCINGPHVTVRTREGPQKHHLNRIIRAPISYLPPGLELVPPATASTIRPARHTVGKFLSLDKYIIDRLKYHAQEDDEFLFEFFGLVVNCYRTI